MSWAARRRLVILIIAGAVVAAFIAIVLIATLYKTPTCTDGVQNQDEAGIDCGGPCPYLCTAQVQPPTVLFTKVLRNSAGRTDIVAMVENKNIDAAARNVPYRIALYGTDRSLIREIAGTLDLPPGTRVPVYIPGIASGVQGVQQAFLDMTASAPQWFRMTADSRIRPVISNITISGAASTPRVEATLSNASAATMTNTTIIVFVHDDQGEVITASQTIVPSIPAQGQAIARFTWQEPFVKIPVSIEIMPVISLP